jgi:hypothetical protein
MMEATGFSATSALIYQTTEGNNFDNDDPSVSIEMENFLSR